MPRRRNANGYHQVTADINITSLVDVAFTLLVIFIITAPIMQGGVDVRVPRAQAETISNPGRGDCFRHRAMASCTSAKRRYRATSSRRRSPTWCVRRRRPRSIFVADEGVPYGTVLQVLGSMKALDIANVGLVAEPETGRGAGRRR